VQRLVLALPHDPGGAPPEPGKGRPTTTLGRIAIHLLVTLVGWLSGDLDAPERRNERFLALGGE